MSEAYITIDLGSGTATLMEPFQLSLVPESGDVLLAVMQVVILSTLIAVRQLSSIRRKKLLRG